jgi:hypothetical protein
MAMTQDAPDARGNLLWSKLSGAPILPILFGVVLLCGTLTAAFGAKKTEKTITSADGNPVRKIYVDAGTPAMANTAAARLSQDTCLIVVSNPSQADAVLQLGVALPAVAGDEAGGPDVFGSKPHAQTLGDAHNSPKRTASATCSDGKGGSGGCTSSYSVQGGELPEQAAAEWPGNAGASYDVSLASPGENSQELWEPDGYRKHVSWSDQLREAAGCPVCPGEPFNPRRDKMTYRQWMQAKCPGVLTSTGNQ